MSTTVTVKTTLGIDLNGIRTAMPGELRYDRTDPLAVSLVFVQSGCPVDWLISLDALAHGSDTTTVAAANVRIPAPGSGRFRHIVMTGDGTTFTVTVAEKAIRRLVKRATRTETLRRVAGWLTGLAGRRGEAIDRELNAMLADTWRAHN